MAKMPFVPDPRYMDAKDQYKTQNQIKEDVSSTQRQPYPQEHQINLPRFRMKE
jgi:DNA polymerase-3 subunit alpha/error-prone DNA polymerase